MGATCEIRLTRYYDAPSAEVWGALTEPESLARWLAPARGLDLEPGGSIEFRLDGARALAARVRAIEPRRLLELDWLPPGEEPSIVRFELSANGAGTMLVLDHRRVDAVLGMRSLARWERQLRRLDALLAAPAVPR